MRPFPSSPPPPSPPPHSPSNLSTQDKDREFYLGHSIKAPVGRWQNGKDLTWYNKDKGDDADERERVRLEELKKVKEAEEDALAEALCVPYLCRTHPPSLLTPRTHVPQRLRPDPAPSPLSLDLSLRRGTPRPEPSHPRQGASQGRAPRREGGAAR